ncbi:hypothetical protein MKS88_004055 [Plasmodium brasilianum]|uniref:Uncharacterized protein n=1 Tax=Plasmodium brasilianum TaxID=5824 RepID=A0ACB9Y3W0_PLABR|nr:hypothetical protein MKS88_004055 [Plasmodium brasilianum]
MEGKQFNNRKISVLLNSIRCAVLMIAIIFVLFLNIYIYKVMSFTKLHLSSRYSRNLFELYKSGYYFLRSNNIPSNSVHSESELNYDISNNLEDSNYIIEDDLNNIDELTLHEKCQEVFHYLTEEQINEIINSVSNSQYKTEALNTWLRMRQNDKHKVDYLKNYLSAYLEELKGEYNVNEEKAQEEMNKFKVTIDSTIRVMEDYYSKLFHYCIIDEQLPQTEYDNFINKSRLFSNLFIRDLRITGKSKLNNCIIYSN